MARYDDINAPAVAYATALSCVALFVIIQSIQALTNYWDYDAEAKALARYEYVQSDRIIDEQLKSISNYEWVNVPGPDEKAPMEKRLHIPIQRAEEVVLEEAKASGV